MSALVRTGLALFLVSCATAPCPGNDAEVLDDDAGHDAGSDAGPPLVALRLSPEMLGFSDCGSSVAPIQVTNVGTVPTGPITVSWSTGTVGFRTVDSTCALGLPVGGDCTVDVQHEEVVPASGTLEVRAPGATASATFTVPMIFDCGGFLGVSPTPYAFPDTPVGGTAGHLITVTMTGSPPGTVSSVSLGGLDATQFAIAADGCTARRYGSVDTCSIDVTFAPTAPGDFSALVSVTTTNLGTRIAGIAGRGL